MFGLHLVEFRREGTIEVYKILRILDLVGVERMFPLVAETRTKDHFICHLFNTVDI